MAKKPTTPPSPPPRPPEDLSPSFVVLVAARRLIEDKKVTLKELAAKVDMPSTSLAAMLAPAYENMTLTRIDALKAAVREIRKS